MGVPDPKFVEEVWPGSSSSRAATLTEDEIRALLPRRLAHYKVPRYVRSSTRSRKTVTGKIQKFKIREQMITDLGLKEEATA